MLGEDYGGMEEVRENYPSTIPIGGVLSRYDAQPCLLVGDIFPDDSHLPLIRNQEMGSNV